MLISGLRLPCDGEHEGCTAEWSLCGGRVPTRRELIDMLGIDHAAAIQAMNQLYGKGDHGYPAQEIVAAALGIDP